MHTDEEKQQARSARFAPEVPFKVDIADASYLAFRERPPQHALYLPPGPPPVNLPLSLPVFPTSFLLDKHYSTAL